MLIATCASTRYVHLEVVDSLSAEDTLQALCRIFGRRGVPELVYSDNGRAFVSLASEFERMKKEDKLEASLFFPYSAPNWKTSAPYSPWQGGFFERLIGCVKRILRSTLRGRVLPRTQFTTLLIQAEAMVNSRPLLAESSEQIITPAHFAGTSGLLAVPSPQRQTRQVRNVLREHAEYKKLQDAIWKSWKSDYLTSLRNRWWSESQVPIAVAH